MKDVTYFRKSALGTSKSGNDHLHVTLGERRQVDLLGVVVRHDDRESVRLNGLEKSGVF